MNVIEMINDELKNKNWTSDEKAYYIYLRSCQLFSYDPRFQFCKLMADGDKLEYEICSRKIDLENVDNNLVVCTTHTREVLMELLKQLLNINAQYFGMAHAWTAFNDSKRIIRADSTNSGDIVRAKIRLKTNGYKTINRDYNFPEYLKETARKIDYIKDEYNGYYIEQRSQELLKVRTKEKIDESIIERLYEIKSIFENINIFQNISDASSCIGYLCNKILGRDDYRRTTIPLFQRNEDTLWEFVNLYPIELDQETIYFILEKVNNKFCFYEITKQDALHYFTNLNGIKDYKISR